MPAGNLDVAAHDPDAVFAIDNGDGQPAPTTGSPAGIGVFGITMRIEQTFIVASSPESVFDYLTDPGNLCDWQTAHTRVEVLTEGPPRQGYRVREWTKPPARREWVQVVEFTEFDRPRRLHVHIVEGPFPVDGTWVFSARDGGTRVDFVAEGPLRGLTRLAAPIVRRVMARQFVKYHENLRRNIESNS